MRWGLELYPMDLSLTDICASPQDKNLSHHLDTMMQVQDIKPSVYRR